MEMSSQRTLRRLINKLAQILAMAEEKTGMTYRSGDYTCEMCGWRYSRHATCPLEPWITILCDGRRVKL